MQSLRPTIFMMVMLLAPSAWAGTEVVLHDFSGGSDGSLPANVGRVARDESGNLYGTTQGGGACSQGTVFQISKSGGVWTENVLYSFCGGDGNNPVGGVVLDSTGNIYSTTKFGSGSGCGTVFKVSGSTQTTLYGYTCGSDGGKPDAGVILDKNGNLYGTTQLYGAFGSGNGGGVAYELSSSGTFSVIYSFCSLSACLDGNSPDAGLVMADGVLSMAQQRMAAITPAVAVPCLSFRNRKIAGVETVLHSFAGGNNDGANPTFASLTL